MSVRETAARAYREGLPALATSVFGGLLAGVVLGGMRAELRAVPGLLVLVPALLATRGNVYGSLGARLSTALHQGLIRPRFRGDERLRRAVAAALANGLLASGFAACVAFLVLARTGRCVAGPHVLLGVALLSGLLSGVALATVVVVAVFLGFRRGYNPDTVVGPVVTTAGDVFGVAFLLLAARAVLLVAEGGCFA
ncbi:MAG: magnesium transporter [Haloarculaceae archaeon]